MVSRAYIIRWKSKVNGRAGRGTKAFTYEEAERLASQLNEEYPDIEHDVIPALAPQRQAAKQPPEPDAGERHEDFASTHAHALS